MLLEQNKQQNASITSEIFADNSTVSIGTYQVAGTIHNQSITIQHISIDKNASHHKTPEWIWNIPSPSSAYIERKKLMSLAEDLNAEELGKKHAIAIITGPPGVGKTQAAYHYAYLYMPNMPNMPKSEKYPGGGFLLDATNESRLFESYKKLAMRLNLMDLAQIADPEFNKEDQINIITTVQKKLSDYNRLLLIYDNAPDMKTVEKFLPPIQENSNRPLHHIIITSYNSFWEGSKCIHLDNYSEEESRAYICKAFIEHDISLPSNDKIDKLSRALFNYPLALSQAVRTLGADDFLSIEEYIKSFDLKATNSKNNFLNQGSLDDTGKTLQITWRLAIEKLKQKRPEYAEQFDVFFETMTCFKPTKVPIIFFHMLFFHAYKWTNQQVHDFLNTCSKHGLLEASNLITDKDSIKLHEALHAVLKFEYKENIQKIQEKLITAIARYIPYDQFEESSINIWLLMHADIAGLLDDASEHLQKTDSFLLIKINLIGFFIFENTNYPLAKKMCNELNDENIRNLPHKDQGKYCLYKLVSTIGNYKKMNAEILEDINKIRDIFSERSSIKDSLYQATLNNLKSVYFSLWGYPDKALLASDEAISMFTEQNNAINLHENLGHSRVYIKVFFSKAKILLEYGQYSQSITLLQPVLNFIKNNEGNFSAYYYNYYYMAALMFIGQANMHLGNYEIAKEYYSSCKELLSNKKVLRSQWVMRSQSQYYINRGCLNHLQGKNFLAYHYYKLGQKILNKIYGKIFDTALMENILNIIEVRLTNNDHVNISLEIENANHMWQNIFEEKQTNLTKAKLFLFQGWYNYKQNSPHQAYKFLQQSTDIFQNFKTEKNRHLGIALFILAELSKKHWKYQDAIHYLNRCIEHFPNNSLLYHQASQELRVVKNRSLILNFFMLTGCFLLANMAYKYHTRSQITKKINLR